MSLFLGAPPKNPAVKWSHGHASMTSHHMIEEMPEGTRIAPGRAPTHMWGSDGSVRKTGRVGQLAGQRWDDLGGRGIVRTPEGAGIPSIHARLGLRLLLS